MGSFVIIILLLAILQSILFYNHELGLNVILFLIPLLVFLVYVLSNKKKIKNVKGLLFLIPITLLGLTYFLYTNEDFNDINTFVIPLLIIFMYIYTIKPTYSFSDLLPETLSFVFEPISCISKFYRVVKSKINSSKKEKKKEKKLTSVLVILPIVVVVILLLGSADPTFKKVFSIVYDFIKEVLSENIIGRLIVIFIFFTYLGATINYLLYGYDSNRKDKKVVNNIKEYTMKLLLTVLNVIYIVFAIIQIKSLIFNDISGNMTYAEYARNGFFQLMVISLINLIILFLSKRVNGNKYEKYNNVMGVVLVVLTAIIISSSFIRMYMYECAYGFTTSRILVYAALVTESIVLIPTTIYIFNPKLNIFKYYLITIVSVYTFVCILPIDYIIANKNINMYYEDNDIDFDLEYLENGNYDNINLLIDLYNNTNDNYMKHDLEDYFEEISDSATINGIEEFNISKYNAIKKIEDFNS